MNEVRISQEDYIKDRLENQIDWYDKKSIRSQKLFKRLQVIVILSSATIPFLSGYMDGTSLYLKVVIGLLGLVIASITAIIGLYRFQENWLEYRTTCETLRHEKYLYLAKATPYNEERSFLLLVERIESLISKENTNWQSFMKNPGVVKDKS